MKNGKDLSLLLQCSKEEIGLKIYSALEEVGLWLVTLSCLFYGGLNVVGVELNRLGEKANEEERKGNTKKRFKGKYTP